MAKKAEYLVIDGCIQEGRAVTVKGEPYSPTSKEATEALLAAGKIALVTDPIARQLLGSTGGESQDGGD